jgi:hypothetical protein
MHTGRSLDSARRILSMSSNVQGMHSETRRELPRAYLFCNLKDALFEKLPPIMKLRHPIRIMLFSTKLSQGNGSSLIKYVIGNVTKVAHSL